MRAEGIARVVASSALMLGVAVGTASGASIEYSWSGRVEPFGAENPWGLTGDGSAVTPNDGTPFTLEVFVDEAAVDQPDGLSNPDYAEFLQQNVTLIIGDNKAALTRPKLSLADDQFTGSFDSIDFDASVELFGTALSFSAGVRLAASTFDLVSPGGADLPPTFADTLPIQFGGTGSAKLVTMPANAPVTGAVVPWPLFPSATAVEWTSGTTGTAGGVDVTLSNIGGASPTFVDLSGPAFDAAPFFASTDALDYETGSTWTVTLSEPVATLLLYVGSWRGTQGGVDPVTYHFDVPFTIRSGLAEASIVGNFGGLILSLPATGFHDGILHFEGPLSSLTVTPNTTSGSQQLMAMAVVPLPEYRAVNWASPTTGTAGAIGVTLAGLGFPNLESSDLAGPDYATARLSTDTEVVSYTTGSDWSATLSEPIEGLLLYTRAWRGGFGGVDPVTYRFDAPFTILSGLDQATVSEDGTLLSVPGSDFHDGILFFGGPLTSLGVDTNSTSEAVHEMTLAVVPEAGAAAASLAALAALLLLRRAQDT